jgi:hypothetical protein
MCCHRCFNAFKHSMISTAMQCVTTLLRVCRKALHAVHKRMHTGTIACGAAGP